MGGTGEEIPPNERSTALRRGFGYAQGVLGGFRKFVKPAWSELQELSNDALGQYREIKRVAPLALLLLVAIPSLLFIVVALFYYLGLSLRAMVPGIFQTLGIIVAGLIVSVSVAVQSRLARESRLAQGSAQRQIYQQLELESIELFRFDNENTDIARYIWSPDETLSGPQYTEPEQDIRLLQYVCQILNLFEMAIRFRSDDVMPLEVFGSWVIWIDSLCASKTFCHYWRERETDLRWNYIPKLREMIDGGLEIHHGSAPPPSVPGGKTRDFFEFVARTLGGDKEVRAWLSEVAAQ